MQTYPGTGRRLGNRDSEESVFQRTTQSVKGFLPTLYQYMPNKAVSIIRDQFWKVPAASLVATVIYDESFLYTTGFSAVAAGVSLVDRNVSDRQYVEKASLSLLALHAIKFGYNTVHYAYVRDLPSALGACLDLCIAAKLGLILLNRNSQHIHSS